MSDLQSAKAVVRNLNAALDRATPEQVVTALKAYVTPDYRWRGMHPFDELAGASAVAASFWSPLKSALVPLQRRPDIFLAGYNSLEQDNTIWVVEMGHWMGLWDSAWIGIAPSHKIAFLRYAEFHCVEDDKITETACYVDLLNLVAQKDQHKLRTGTGVTVLTPGPLTHNGLLYDPQIENEGRTTVDLITAMINDLRANAVHSPDAHLTQFWTPDMCWFGPGGIGASAFFDGYRRGHAGPFEQGLEYVRHTEHVCRIGEGNFGGFFGYPSLTVRSTGGFMGLPPSDTPADMRIVDLYRRDKDKLAENWIFIDLPHFFSMQGINLLNQLK